MCVCMCVCQDVYYACVNTFVFCMNCVHLCLYISVCVCVCVCGEREGERDTEKDDTRVRIKKNPPQS